MKEIKIGNEEYTMKYSMRAAVHKDCIKQITNLMLSADSENNNDLAEAVSEIAPTVIEAFYAGLLENHGTHKYGDGRVPDKDTAEELLFEYMDENKDADAGSFVGVLNIIVDCMNDDGFFKRIGLDRLAEMSQPDLKKQTKTTRRKTSAK